MNGYLQRLMRQSAVRIDQNDADQKIQSFVPASGAVTPGSDIVEVETLREAPLSQRPAIAAGQAYDPPNATAASPAPTDQAPARTNQAPARTDQAASRRDQAAAAPGSYVEATPNLESPRLAQSLEAPGGSATGVIPFVSIGQTSALASPNEQMPATKTNPSMDESLAGEKISRSAPNAQEIVQEVVAWVTDTRISAAEVESTELMARTGQGVELIPVRSSRGSQEPRATNAPLSADDSPGIDFPDSDTFHPAEAHSSASPTAKTESWSVQIDSIHLTIEEPAPKPPAVPVVPQITAPSAPASSQFTPSQLRRHYLRPS